MLFSTFRSRSGLAFAGGGGRAHLWLDGENQIGCFSSNSCGSAERSPAGRKGRFSFLHLPFSLLALVAPVPSACEEPCATGSYDLTGRGPLLTTELALEQARFGAQALRLERRAAVLSSDGLELDLALRSDGAAEALKVRGRIPLTLRDALDLELEGHGDASVSWHPLRRRPDVDSRQHDMRLMLSGYLDQPQANGFLVVRDGAFTAGDQSFENVNASLLFDFNRVEVSKLGRNWSLGEAFPQPAGSACSSPVKGEATKNSPEAARIRQEMLIWQLMLKSRCMVP